MADNHPAGRDPAALRNTLDIQINPATEDSLLTLISTIGAFPAGLVTAQFNQIALSYNGNGDVATVLYKLNGSTVATLTLSYDASFQLIDVVKS